MDTTTKGHGERPRASALSIINFLLLCVVLIFMLSISARVGTPTAATTTTTAGADTGSVQQEITNLSTKIDTLTSSVQSSKATSTKPFNYLSCSGSTINSGSVSTMSSQCYPY